jgi:signal transduction histidine kinase
MELDVDMFSLPNLMSDVQRMLSSHALKKGVNLEFEIDPSVTVVYADKSKIKTILHHLISNGIKFTPSGGSVLVNIRKSKNNELHLTVADSGIGISEEDQKLLYNAFVQLDWSLNRKFEGSGLGLSIVKKFVEVQGGSISLESKPGEGSTFEVILPLPSSETSGILGDICNSTKY